MNALALVQIEGWTLARGGFEEPRVRDIEIADRLGYSHVKKLRELIEEHSTELSAYGEVEWRVQNALESVTSGDDAAKNGFNPQKGEKGQKQGRPAGAYYLNEEQALLLSMFSGAPRAPEVRRALIAAFKAVKLLIGRHSYLESRLLEFEQRRDWEILWGPEIVAAICKLYRWPTHNANGTMYAPLAVIFDRLYRLFLGDAVVDEMKERNPTPSRGKNHHQLLQEKVREMVGTDVVLVKTYADMSATPSQWWAKLRTHFRHEPYQLTF
jgi:hypothetical protein